ncbi:MAG TPA: DUF3822 family protein [Ohtaekwangia sp.]|nr:DUF3822 family protein [Ohtaekwangia sp.]
MQTIALNYKLIKKVRDERFDEDQIHQYHLLVNIGTRDFQLAVIHPDDKTVLLMEDFVLPNITSHEELLQLLDQLFDSHAILKAGFWKKIKVAFKNQKFIQVPEALYAPEAQEEYLKFNAHIDPEREIFLSSSNDLAKAITIFAINKDLKQWIDGVYPTNKPLYTHQSAALIEGVVHMSRQRKDNPLYIYVDRFKLHIIACRDQKLLYYNQFAIKQFSDYIKYIMMVMKSLNMDQQTSEVVLWGYIGKNSPHYNEFYKYINNVGFGNHPAHLKFGFAFDEVQDHHFFDLYSIHLIDS